MPATNSDINAFYQLLTLIVKEKLGMVKEYEVCMLNSAVISRQDLTEATRQKEHKIQPVFYFICKVLH
jgi:hypothetical protein